MKFDNEVKMAFVKMIHEVIYADGKVHPGEIEELTKLKQRIEFDEAYLTKAQELDYDEAIGTLYNMPYDQKKILAEILDDVANSDGTLHQKEMTLIIDTFINIGIGEESE